MWTPRRLPVRAGRAEAAPRLRQRPSRDRSSDSGPLDRGRGGQLPAACRTSSARSRRRGTSRGRIAGSGHRRRSPPPDLVAHNRAGHARPRCRDEATVHEAPSRGTPREQPVGPPVTPEVAELVVERTGQRPGAVDVGVDDRLPVVVRFRSSSLNTAASSSGTLAGRISGAGRRSPKARGLLPPSAAARRACAGTLERRPVLVEAVEELRVDRVRGLQPLARRPARGTRPGTRRRSLGRESPNARHVASRARASAVDTARTAAGARSRSPPRRSPAATRTPLAHDASRRAPPGRRSPPTSMSDRAGTCRCPRPGWRRRAARP